MKQHDRTSDAKRIALGEWHPSVNSMNDLPKVEPLCSPLQPNQYIGSDRLEADVAEAARGWADQIQRISIDLGLPLLCVEMAVIADRRRQPPKSRSFFTCYISVFSDDAPKIHEAYRDGVERGVSSRRRQSEEFLYDDPIVIHEELYQHDTGYFYKAFEGTKNESHSGQEYAGNLCAYGFPLEGETGFGSPKSVPRQLDDFVKVLQESADERGIGNILQGCSLFLVPFLRPEYSIPKAIGSSQSSHATPGGCVFLIFSDKLEADDKRVSDLMRTLRWLLAEASASESQTAFESSARQRDFVAAMSHGTVSAIRGINSTALRGLLVHKDADLRTFTTDDLIINFNNLSEHEESHKRLLAKQIHRMVLAEGIAASLAGFAEIRADGGLVRPKFQSNQECNVRGLLDDAWLVASKSLDDQVFLKTGDTDDGQEWLLPSGYVSDQFLRGLMMELLQNAIQHGCIEGCVSQPIRTSVFAEGGQVVVQIENDMQSGGEIRASISGFLSRVMLLLHDFGGIGLRLKNDEGIFRAQIWLGKVQISQNGESGFATETLSTRSPFKKGDMS